MRKFLALLFLPLFLAPAHIASADPLVASAPAIKTPKKAVGVLSIPKLNVTSKVYIGVTMDVFDRGVGQWPGTPPIGESGNIVIGGHRTSGKRPFYNLDKLVPGDTITLKSKSVVSRYVVTKSFIVKPTAVWIINPSSDSRLTLFSCHPKGSTSKRLVVQATLVQ